MQRTLPLLLALTVACVSATPHEPHPDAERKLAVGFVIVDGVYNTELTAPYDIFQHTIFHVDPAMSVFTVAPSLAPVTTFEGLRVTPDYTFDNAPRIDVLVVPSAEHNMDTDLEDERLIGFVRDRGAQADWILSLCDGAFVLAQAGLLDGREVTTFPADRERLREMFPQLNVLDDTSFVHDGKAITSQGGAPSFDPSMFLADLLYGTEATQGIGRGLIIPWPPKDMAAIVVEPTS